jgi:hypothetical protein
MPNRFTLNPDDLDELFERIGAERRRVGAHRVQWQANPTQAAMLADLAGRRYQMAPWVPPDAILAATLAGVDDEMFATLAESSGHATMARGGLIEAAQREDISNPFGLIGVLASRTPEQQAQTQAELNARRAAGMLVADDGGLWKYVKGASRVATGALMTPYEVVTNVATGAAEQVGAVGGPLFRGEPGKAFDALIGRGESKGTSGLSDPGLDFGSVQATTAGQAASQLVSTGRVDTGEGYFVGGDVHAAQARRARQVRGTVPGTERRVPLTGIPIPGSGHAWTIGRLAVSTVTEPGTKPFDYLSGAIDFAAALGLDPANYLIPGSGARRARRAAIVVPAGEARALGTAEEALTEAQRLQGVAGEAAKAGDLASFEGVSGLAAERAAAAAETVAGVEARTGVAKARRAATPEWRAQVDAVAGILEGGPGTRRSVLAPRAMKWLLGDDGRRVMEKVGSPEMNSPSEIIEAFGGKIDVAGALALAEVDTPQKAIAAFARVFNGGTLRELPTIGHWSGEIGPLKMRVANRARDRFRIFGELPSTTYLDPADPEDAYRVLRDTLGNVNITGDDRRRLLDGWIQAKGSGQPGRMYTAMGDVGTAVRQQLVEAGMDNEAASALTDWKKAYGRATEYLVDDLGNSVSFDFLDGSKGPTRVVELLSSGQWVFDPEQVRELRTLTSRLAAIPGFKTMSRAQGAFHTHVQAKIWKPLVLIRPAYLTRVNGEEVIRTLFGGKFRHASDWILATVGHGYGTDLAGEGFDLGKRLTKLDEEIDAAQTAGLGTDDLLAEQQRIVEKISGHFGDDYVDALAGRVRGRAAGIALRDDNMAEYMVRTGNWVKVNKADAPREWNKGQIDELIKLHSDPVARRVANGGLLPGDAADGLRPGLDGIEDWLLNGAGTKVADRIAAAYPGVNRQELVRRWLDMAVRDVNWRTGRNADLLDVIASGRLRGNAAFKTTERGTAASDDLRAFVNDWRAADEAPDWVKYEQQLSSSAKNQRNAFVSWFFGELYGKTSDYLARSPTFRKHYWERVGEIAGTLTPDEAMKALGQLDTAKLPGGLRDKVRAQLAAARGSNTLDDVDMVAKGFALDETRKLLVDATRKSQMADVFRVIFPFGEAWREIITTWTRIGAENPRIFNAARKAIVAGREADPDQNGQGFLYENAWGKEVFAYPLAGRLGEWATGVNVAFEGELLGMSLATQVIPGIGPAAAFLISDLVPDSPDWDFASEILFPYGEPSERDTTPLELALPGWAQKLGAKVPGLRGWFGLDNPEKNVVYGNTYMEVSAALASSGDYDLQNPQDLIRLDDDARNKAKTISAIRGFIQMTGPASPGLAYTVATLEGDVLVAKLAEDFRKLQAEDYDTAVARFLDRYGEGIWVYLASKSYAVNPGISPTEEFGKFERQNKQLFSLYPNIAAYFGPAGGEFSVDVYNAQVRRGRREKRTPNERLAEANDILARSIYQRAKDQLPSDPTAEQEAWLADVKADLMEDFIGFDPALAGFEAQERFSKQLIEVQKAANDRNVQRTEAGEALLIYLDKRDEVIAAQVDQGVSTSTTRVGKGAKAKHLREFLREVGADLVTDYPSFGRLWSDILSRELGIEDVEVAA